MLETIERRPLHQQARDILEAHIARGDLAPGERINETRVAEEIGLSRTPLRQALAGLERDGLVETRPGLGFFVTETSPEEARQIYQLLSDLEPLAVRMDGYRGDDLAELRALNEEFSAAMDLRETVERNLVWHDRLIDGCPNVILREMLKDLRTRARRYEYLYFAPGPTTLASSVDLHTRIVTALERSDPGEAGRVLRDHWLLDLDRLAAPRSTE